ncbi:MAG: EcoAI/FtnUII family type I restriction enzme subunit R, partial [Alkalispirochaeta sp.]
MNKTDLSETDIRTKFITPALIAAGWDPMTQLREELQLTAGRVMVQGRIARRRAGKRADYVLFYKPGIPIAIVEAKDNTHPVGAGIEQAIDYARLLDVPFVYSSNGDAFLERDLTASTTTSAATTAPAHGGAVERELPLTAFPSPQELWNRWKGHATLTPEQEQLVLQDYYTDGSGKAPRYYQLTAINRTLAAVANGQRRLLLVMATGTGKTFTAFQIIYRLWKSRTARRILFLADRDALINQTRNNDFRPFGDVMTRITNRTVDSSYEVYLSLYQAITGPEDHQKTFRRFSPDFFDLVVIDECHRGSAREDSAWREILEYFNSAIHLGLTATPKETEYISNITYFGDPIYIYSLRQGIADGFLAPYKVVRVTMDKDDGWRPDEGMTDRYGEEIPDQVYELPDFDRLITLSQRTKTVAARIIQFLANTDPMSKTIIFCENIEHAEHMRSALVNAAATTDATATAAADTRYITRITGDNPAGKALLDKFQDSMEPYPVIAVTSRLLTTGVDVRACRLIVIDRTVKSLTEFKQMVGRGTRIDEEYGKLYFTIVDFRRATNLFADPDFDGEPVAIYEPDDDEDLEEPDTSAEPDPDTTDHTGSEAGDEPDPDNGDESAPRRRPIVDPVNVDIVHERVQYLDEHGKLITESLRDYSRNRILDTWHSRDEFLAAWSSAERKALIIEELAERGVLLDALKEVVGTDYDEFDLVCHIAFDEPPKTRRERAARLRQSDYFSRYGETARAVIDAILDKYATDGVTTIEDTSVLKLPPISQLGSVKELVKPFGGTRDGFLRAIRELEAELYR